MAILFESTQKTGTVGEQFGLPEDGKWRVTVDGAVRELQLQGRGGDPVVRAALPRLPCGRRPLPIPLAASGAGRAAKRQARPRTRA